MNLWLRRAIRVGTENNFNRAMGFVSPPHIQWWQQPSTSPMMPGTGRKRLSADKLGGTRQVCNRSHRNEVGPIRRLLFIGTEVSGPPQLTLTLFSRYL